jgi:hypothetical protein
MLKGLGLDGHGSFSLSEHGVQPAPQHQPVICDVVIFFKPSAICRHNVLIETGIYPEG